MMDQCLHNGHAGAVIRALRVHRVQLIPLDHSGWFAIVAPDEEAALARTVYARDIALHADRIAWCLWPELWRN